MVLFDFREIEDYYSLKDHNGLPQMSSKRHKSLRKGFSIHTSLLCLILSGTILTLFGILYVDNIPWHIGSLAIDRLAVNFGYRNPVYAIVIDAGSTGSRIHAFTFHESYIGSNFVLDKELFKYNKVGLSSFADNPEEGVKSIRGLIEQVKREIPKEHWTNTTLLLRATAGLRLLEAEKAENLLQSLKKHFKNEPFLTQDNSVEIMKGTDEGIFSWFTVNFLLGRINGNPTKTVAALDLGGGSIQVTFAALAPSSLKLKDRIQLAFSLNERIPVYTHSFLGLGLKAAMKKILTFGHGNKKNLTSECVNHIITEAKFKYGTEIYFVSGPKLEYSMLQLQSSEYRQNQDIPIVNMDKCTSLIRSVVVQNSKPPEELSNKAIFAFGYFFVRAADAGLIDPYTGGQLVLQDFKNAAIEACRDPNAEQPFTCLELSFIWILLEDGLGLKLETPINLFKTINNHEVSWALGAAYNALKTQRE